MAGAAPTHRHVVIVGFDGVQSLDVTGPLEVFTTADLLLAARRDPTSGRRDYRHATYTVELVGPAPITTSSGLTLTPRRALDDVDLTRLDTLIIPGGMGHADAVTNPTLLAQITTAAAHATRVASVCTGAFILAAAGLLDGRHATTHWASTDRLAEQHPAVTVEPDRIFVRDGNVWTSAGVTAGIDLALELVAQDHGRALAADVARWLVMFVQRPGGQTQFSTALTVAETDNDPVRDLHAWMLEHPDADLSVEALAARTHLSPRTLHRLVRRELGLTPGELVEQVRMTTARRLLETTDLPISAVAKAGGFQTVSTLYRAFDRTLGTAPAAYRSHFQRQRQPQRQPQRQRQDHERSA
jgi:transcriptional regulator GlxA family with amidase domain